MLAIEALIAYINSKLNSAEADLVKWALEKKAAEAKVKVAQGLWEAAREKVHEIYEEIAGKTRELAKWLREVGSIESTMDRIRGELAVLETQELAQRRKFHRLLDELAALKCCVWDDVDEGTKIEHVYQVVNLTTNTVVTYQYESSSPVPEPDPSAVAVPTQDGPYVDYWWVVNEHTAIDEQFQSAEWWIRTTYTLWKCVPHNSP